MPNYRQSVAHFLLKERKVNIISEIPDRIRCTICRNVIFNARQSPCGCHYCYDCILNFLNGESKYCPGKTLYCQEEKIKMDVNVVDDFSTDREIRRLRFRCQNSGCTFEDEVRLMDEHLQACPFGEEMCDLCGLTLMRMEIDKHMHDECDNRSITCNFCGEDFMARIMIEEHTNMKSNKLCSKFVSVCPLNCNVTEPIVICKHRLTCANRPRNCPFEVVGCPAQGFTKRELNGHIKDHIFDHSRILFEQLSSYKTEIVTLTSRLAKIEQKICTFVWKIDKFSSFIDSNSKRSRSFSPEFSLGDFSYRAKMEMNISDENLQLFFTIVRGEYDDILEWPFDKNVTITIMDQSGTANHYSKLLKTSMEPELFKKATDTKVKGLGWDKFIELSVLHAADHLLRNDRLFIKCTVDI